jgi:hypothetical protein
MNNNDNTPQVGSLIFARQREPGWWKPGYYIVTLVTDDNVYLDRSIYYQETGGERLPVTAFKTYCFVVCK